MMSTSAMQGGHKNCYYDNMYILLKTANYFPKK